MMVLNCFLFNEPEEEAFNRFVTIDNDEIFLRSFKVFQ